MSEVAITGNDTAIVNDRVIAGGADGNVFELEFPDDVMTVKVGKNGNALFAVNENGKRADVTVRLVRGSADDKYFNGLLQQQLANPAGFILMDGEFIKKVGDGKGNVSSDTYVMSGGVFSKATGGKNNVEGDTEASVSVYHLKFAKAIRAIT